MHALRESAAVVAYVCGNNGAVGGAATVNLDPATEWARRRLPQHAPRRAVSGAADWRTVRFHSRDGNGGTIHLQFEHNTVSAPTDDGFGGDDGVEVIAEDGMNIRLDVQDLAPLGTNNTSAGTGEPGSGLVGYRLRNSGSGTYSLEGHTTGTLPAFLAAQNNVGGVFPRRHVHDERHLHHALSAGAVRGMRRHLLVRGQGFVWTVNGRAGGIGGAPSSDRYVDPECCTPACSNQSSPVAIAPFSICPSG